MKKQKKPGDNISLKTKKNEAPAIIDWINAQSNLMDSIRFLVENEIKANGVRNLQQHVPSDRGFMDEVAAGRYEESTAPTGKSLAYEEPAEEEIDEDDIDSWT
ncbi:hypothetical protein A374_06901 [Fictibacillus macauensis ZFHKF-1]|uniref:Uncharacterized protein n=1 Tax=Fictibacillus macauensis ZFHKF-1 TaxID=1196324 RepID=I8UGU8_9BACL|nr:hypothetical protein [Fictibacillus macauensis]EIT86028.1 hypothetical protein A374_06901 [Fictibacillus macauensis ZFHKF-1]